jgi:hypothetical protein
MDGQQPTQALACATQGERIGLPPPGHPAASPPGYRDSTLIHADPAIQIIIEAAYLGCCATGCSFHVRGMYKIPRSLSDNGTSSTLLAVHHASLRALAATRVSHDIHCIVNKPEAIELPRNPHRREKQIISTGTLHNELHLLNCEYHYHQMIPLA